MLKLLPTEEVQVRLGGYSLDQLDRLVEEEILPPWIKLNPAPNAKRFQFEHVIEALLETVARENGIPLPPPEEDQTNNT
jgi:hypothetical protein